jgi:hypothetical protein
MGSYTDPSKFGQAIANYGVKLQKSQKVAANAVALEIKTAIEIELAGAVGADMKMSNAGGKKSREGGGALMRVRYDVVGERNVVAAIYALAKSGPWKLLQKGAPPHSILAKGVTKGAIGKANKAAKKRLTNVQQHLAVPGVDAYRDRVSGGGTQGVLSNQGKSKNGRAFISRYASHPGTKPNDVFHRAVNKVKGRAQSKASSIIVRSIFGGS